MGLSRDVPSPMLTPQIEAAQDALLAEIRSVWRRYPQKCFGEVLADVLDYEAGLTLHDLHYQPTISLTTLFQRN